jgi:predicted transcriptional regulator
MDCDLKEVIGALMRVIDGGEVSQAELVDLSFEAHGDLHAALTDAYIKLLEFAHDRELRDRDRDADRAMRAQMKLCLDHIVEVCDREARREAAR